MFGWAALAAAWLTLLLLAGILLSLVIGAWPAIEAYGLGFLGRTGWDPDRPSTQYLPTSAQ